MRGVGAPLLAVLVLALTGRGAAALEPLADLKPIMDRGTLIVATLRPSLPPMVMHGENGEDGEDGGFDLRLAREMAAALGVEADIRADADTQDAVIDMVARREADIGIAYLTRSVRAGRYVFFTRPYLVQRYTLMLNRSTGGDYARYCPSKQDLEKLVRQPDRVGVLAFSLYEGFVKRRIPDARLRPFDTLSQMAEATERGDVVGSLLGEVATKYYLSTHPKAAIRVKVCNIIGEADNIAIAVRPDAPDLLRWLDLFIGNRGTVVDAETVIYREDDSRL